MKISFRRFKIRSLKWQLLLRAFAVLVALLIIMEVSQYLIMKQYLYKSREQLLESRFHNVDEEIMKEIESPQLVRENAGFLIQKIITRNMNIAIIDNKGNFVAEAGDPEGNINPPHLSQSEYIKLIDAKGNLDGYKLIKDSNGNEQMVAWRKLGEPDSTTGLIQLGTSAEPVINMLDSQISFYFISSLFVLIVGIFLGGAVLRYTLKPLYDMTNTMEKINVGRLNTRLPTNNGQLEIDRLSDAFNDMLMRIETSFKKEQSIREKMHQFISDASHELRTPLTSIHGFVEILLRGAAKDEKQLNLALNTILTESERLTELVNGLLALTRLDQHVPIEMKEEKLNNIIEEIHPQLQIIAGERIINLQLTDEIFARVNRNQIKQVIIDLVNNAVQHTDEKSGIITISLNYADRSPGKLAELRVVDNGTGIPQDSLEKIFDRFYRSESHRTRKSGGYGLGLAIVKSIIDAHGGEIDVDSEPGKGTTFTVYLAL